MKIIHRLLLLATAMAMVVQGQQPLSDPGGEGIKFSTPDLSEEDYHSPTVPIKYRCDVCRAVAYQVYKLSRYRFKVLTG